MRTPHCPRPHAWVAKLAAPALLLVATLAGCSSPGWRLQAVSEVLPFEHQAQAYDPNLRAPIGLGRIQQGEQHTFRVRGYTLDLNCLADPVDQGADALLRVDSSGIRLADTTVARAFSVACRCGWVLQVHSPEQGFRYQNVDYVASPAPYILDTLRPGDVRTLAYNNRQTTLSCLAPPTTILPPAPITTQFGTIAWADSAASNAFSLVAD